jgi:hypothetical protein
MNTFSVPTPTASCVFVAVQCFPPPAHSIQYYPHDPQQPPQPPPNTGNNTATATTPPSGGFGLITNYHIQCVLHARQPPPRSATTHRVHGSATVGVSSAPAVHDRHSTTTTPLRTTGAGGRPPPVSVSSGYRTTSRRSRNPKLAQHPYSRTAHVCGRYLFECVVTTWVGAVAASVVRCCLYVDCDSTHGWYGVVVVILPPCPVYAVLRHDPDPQRHRYTTDYVRNTPRCLSLFSFTRLYSSVDTTAVGGVCFADMCRLR